MKYFLIIILILSVGSCVSSSDFARLKYRVEADRNEALNQNIKNSRKFFWLTNQNEIKKMRPEYPEDIKLIKAFFQKEYLSGLKEVESKEILEKCGKWCDMFTGKGGELLPVPLHQNETHGRVYLYFRPDLGESDLIHVNKDNIIKKIFFMDRKILYKNEYLEKWRPNTEWQFNENYILNGLD